MPDPVLLVHCRYQQPGGEDVVYEAEVALLEANGHHVERLELHNDALNGMPRVQAAARAVWNGDAARTIERRVRETGARLVHFHNTFPLLSPAVYGGARRAGARVVQTLHNYRLVCPSALMLRDGRPCDDCVGRPFAWPGVQHACYRGSRAATAVVATMVAVHRARGTWTREVDAYVAVSEFLRAQVVRGGLPAERVHVKRPHVRCDPGVGAHDGDYALFVGRLSHEKGIGVVLDAWRTLDAALPLVVLGDGPLRGAVERAAAADPRIRFEGRVPPARVADAMRAARLLVAPSLGYEGAPLALAEAAAAGLPVVSSGIGAMAELVEDGQTGLLVPPGDAQALAAAVARLDGDAVLRARMGRAARARYETMLSAEAAYTATSAIYACALAGAA